MTANSCLISVIAAAPLLTIAADAARAQESTPEGESKERTTGLPKQGEWTFNLDAGAGAFGFDNSLYTNQRPDPSGDLSDDWLESYIKPALSAVFARKHGSLFGKLSAIGARTFSAPPTLVGESASSFHVEDAYVGWRSADIAAGEDGLEITVGRAPYQIGHGLLLWDGAGDGGSRGGFWTGARKAWELAGVGRFKTGMHTIETFFVDRDELPENDTGTELWGANYELALAENTTLGLSYIKASADDEALRDGMDVYNARAYTAPLKSLPGLSFELEYTREDNGDAMEAIGWSAQAGYEMANVAWSPTLSYRYAFFEGDDPATATSEAFDPLFPGFYDWGAWYQGEIGGEYFLSNSNLISHQVRLHFTPNEVLSTGFIGYFFQLDHPGTFADGVSSDDVARELDWYLDWQVNDNFAASFVLAHATPDDAIEEGFDRSESLSYAMVYLSYAY